MERTPHWPMNCRVPVEPSEVAAGKSGEIILRDERARYIVKVLRLREGERITLFDGTGTEYDCNISELKGKSVRLCIEETVMADRESPLSIILCQALPKGKKMDLVLQKGTELGVSRFVPFISSRSVSRPEGGEEKAVRWEKIAFEASRQCGRHQTPAIETIVGFEALIDDLAADSKSLKLIPWEGTEDQGLHSLADRQVSKVILLIGPEGGFSEEEVDRAKEAGFIPITLGKRLLRTETAGIAAVSILQYLWGDI